MACICPIRAPPSNRPAVCKISCHTCHHQSIIRSSVPLRPGRAALHLDGHLTLTVNILFAGLVGIPLAADHRQNDRDGSVVAHRLGASWANATHMAGLRLFQGKIQLAKQLSQSSLALSSAAHDMLTGATGLIDTLAAHQQPGTFVQMGEHFNQPRPPPRGYKKCTLEEMVEFLKPRLLSALLPENGVCIRDTKKILKEKRGHGRFTRCFLTCPHTDSFFDWHHPMLGRISSLDLANDPKIPPPGAVCHLYDNSGNPKHNECQLGSEATKYSFFALDRIDLAMQNLVEYHGQWGERFRVYPGRHYEGQDKCEGIYVESSWFHRDLPEGYQRYKIPLPDLGAWSHCDGW
ncbi:unnamed protein product [Vitrella brassicaformis CCMP3155]|uniref:Uncharacterized protein n=1 Tax=Vitrella brassicaformis (strain CCMP3155) TaxID=1169540 RepID=A0A0G4H448_VITBC|nr:unnamed protein product [Vitrella brassicaformis CCMP3155]|eukprot:CEM38527.1 unnamed protein product [Vitrella brassicaformis CCMP3155]